MVYIVSREVGTFHHGKTLLLLESGTKTTDDDLEDL